MTQLPAGIHDAIPAADYHESMLSPYGIVTLADRLLTRVIVTDGGCWIWEGMPDGSGYGKIRAIDGASTTHSSRNVHRVSYEVFVGPIPPGLTIDHLCRNRGCINWRHLEPVTRRENVLRGNCQAALNARRTNCPKCDGLLTMLDDGVPDRRGCVPCLKAYRRTFGSSEEVKAKRRLAYRLKRYGVAS